MPNRHAFLSTKYGNGLGKRQICGKNHTSLFPMSDNGCFLVLWLPFISAGFSSSARWSSIAPCEATVLVFSASTISEQFRTLSAISDCGVILNLTWTASLLVHLESAQPHDFPQPAPVDLHLHFVVLHKDFLLHEQQIVTAFFSFAALVSPKCSDSHVSRLWKKSSLLPVEKEGWPKLSWSTGV